MKNIIYTILVAAVMVAALSYGMSKTIDNRCAYYLSQAHPTQSEVSMCK